MRKTLVALMAVFFVFSIFSVTIVTIASAGVSTIAAGKSSVCIRAGWNIVNLSEDKETTVHINVGPIGYSWNKNFDRTLAPGGFLSHASQPKSTFDNKGPGDIQLNCQKQDSQALHDWKIDPGSQRTYQVNYHLDHVRPGTYIEPGMGQPEGTERGLFSQRGDATGGTQNEASR